MKAAKVAISIDQQTLSRVDRLVRGHVFPSRSAVIQNAVEEKLDRLEHHRLADACKLLDTKEEQKLAEEGSEDLKEWPEY